jgi:hypothetical protein
MYCPFLLWGFCTDTAAKTSSLSSCLAVYRAIRTQRFLDFTQMDLAQRAIKQREIWEQLEAARKGKLVTKEELDAFYLRLQVRAHRKGTQ